MISFTPALAPRGRTRGDADVFVGREREVDRIFGHLLARRPGHVAIDGALGIGKTSLLRYLADRTVAGDYGATPPGHLLVYLDLQAVAPFEIDRFWRRAAHLIARAPGGDHASPALRHLNRDRLEMSDLESFQDALEALGTRLVLLIDELEWALQADDAAERALTRHFLAQLAVLARRGANLALVTATESPLRARLEAEPAWRARPFAALFTSLSLQPFTRNESDRLLDALGGGQAAAAPLSEGDRALLHASAGGRPAALQAAAQALGLSARAGWAGEAAADLALAQAAARQTLDRFGVAGSASPGPGWVAAHAPRIIQLAPPAAASGGRSKGLWLSQATREVYVDGKRVAAITPLEFNLLQLLYTRPGRPHDKAEILRALWGAECAAEADATRVEKLVSRLRQKLEASPGRRAYIQTVRGRGYRFVPAA